VRVFVLCTGRCGSKSFYKAASHILNYTSEHESKAYGWIGPRRIEYPDNHIEVDNRLSWFLGRLDEVYGSDPMYVHLVRKKEDVAKSYLLASRHSGRGKQIVTAYSVLAGHRHVDLKMTLDYCDTVNANIEYFLRDKPLTMRFEVEKAEDNWPIFFRRIVARGDIEAGLNEFAAFHNARNPPATQ